MSKSFKETFSEMCNASGKEGKKIRSFSRAAFDDLTKAFINDVDYETEYVNIKAGKPVAEKVQPVKKFRNGMCKSLIESTGIDKSEAASILDNHMFKSVEGFYEICTEAVTNYMSTGRKFSFPNRMDFNGSIEFRDMPDATIEYTDIQTKEKRKGHRKAHKRLVHKSKCPAWLKTQTDKK